MPRGNIALILEHRARELDWRLPQAGPQNLSETASMSSELTPEQARGIQDSRHWHRRDTQTRGAGESPAINPQT